MSVALVLRHRDRALRRLGRLRRRRPRAELRLRRRGDARLRHAQARRHRLHDRSRSCSRSSRSSASSSAAGWPTTCSARSASATRRPRSGASRAGRWRSARSSALYSLVFAFAPDIDARRRRIVSPGGLVGVAIWIVASAGFFFYVSNFGKYGATYGAFAGAVILLLWLYLSSDRVPLRRRAQQRRRRRPRGRLAAGAGTARSAPTAGSPAARSSRRRLRARTRWRRPARPGASSRS